MSWEIRATDLEQVCIFAMLTAWRAIAPPGNISPNIQRSDGNGCVTDSHEALFDVIVPDAHILAPALGLDPVIPTVGDIVAINIRIRSWKPLEASIVTCPQDVVEIMIGIGPDFVVADDVISL